MAADREHQRTRTRAKRRVLHAALSLVFVSTTAWSCANVIGLASDGDLTFQSGGADGSADISAEAGGDASSGSCDTTTLQQFTSGISAVNVPAGCHHAAVIATGGGGGDCTMTGGSGAVVQVTIAVDPLAQLTVFVGAIGTTPAGPSTTSMGGAGGALGGEADPESGYYSGGGGGGSSEVALCTPAAARPGQSFMCKRLIVAGGGGGCGDYNAAPGGNGGMVGLNGQAAMPVLDPWAGQGATQSTNGAGGMGSAVCNYMNGDAGAQGVGGAGVWGSGGGGGGYFSGGGGAGADMETITAGGGGGSSYVDPDAGSNAIYSTSPSAGSGSVTIAWQL